VLISKNLVTLLISITLILGAWKNACADESTKAIINDLDQPFDLNPYIQYIEDPNDAISYEDLNSGKYDNLWQLNIDRYFMGRSVTSRYWFRVCLQFTSDLSDKKPLLYIKNHPGLVFDISFWIPNENGKTSETKSGYLHAYGKHNIFDQQIAARLPLTSGSYVLIGKVDNRQAQFPTLMPLYLVSGNNVDLANTISLCMLSAFYAVMLALLLYNACLFLSLRVPLYGCYIVFLSSASLLCAFMDGLTPHLSWLDSAIADYRFNLINIVLVSMAYLVFVWETLERLQFSMQLYRIFKVLICIGLLCLLHDWLSPHFVHIAIIGKFYSGTVMLFTIVSIIYAMLQRVANAGYLFIAELCTLVGSVTTSLATNDLLPINFFTFWSLHIGFLGEALLLSFAVGARTNQAIQEKLMAQNLALANERKANEALQIATKAKNEFLATVSHELRTPLTSIIGFSEAMLEAQQTTETGREYTRTILRSGKNLLTVIDDVLNLSLIDNNKVTITTRRVDIKAWLESLETHYKFIAQQKGLSFSMQTDRYLPQWITTDDENLRQIMGQLFENAFKFTHQGNVQLKVSYESQRQHDTGTFYFVLTDTGVGIAQDKLNTIFEPFTQADSSDARRYGGTGIGLYIAKSLIENMQGNITVESTLDVGSKFTLCIPVKVINESDNNHEINETAHLIQPISPPRTFHQTTTIAEMPAPAAAKPILTGRVLYAEDNPDNQGLVKILVESTGAELIIADNGELALQAIEAEMLSHGKPFDLVLMDLQMPVMNGRDAAQHLRQQGYTAPIIAFSASTLSEIESMADNPFDGYLGKPVERQKLFALLKTYLSCPTGETTIPNLHNNIYVLKKMPVTSNQYST